MTGKKAMAMKAMKTVMKTMKVAKAKQRKNDDETSEDEKPVGNLLAKDEAVESWPSERIVNEPSKFARWVREKEREKERATYQDPAVNPYVRPSCKRAAKSVNSPKVKKPKPVWTATPCIHCRCRICRCPAGRGANYIEVYIDPQPIEALIVDQHSALIIYGFHNCILNQLFRGSPCFIWYKIVSSLS